MSTTVTYKGNTIATLSNETKTLTTAGTWLDANIQITDTNTSSSGSAITITDTTDSIGGTVRTITSVDISDTTAIASDVAQGKYFYTADGTKTAGTASGNGSSPNLGTKTITTNGTYNASSDSLDGYSSVTVSVAGGGTSPATQHNIYFEFSDNTNTTIPIYYNDSFIDSIITSYSPTTYNNKTINLAQLDNTTWYTHVIIPLNTELIDYTAVSNNVAIGNDGAFEQEWSVASDYTPIDPSMTFSYTSYYWYYIGFYDSSYTLLRTLYVMNDATVDENDSNTGHGTLSGNKIPPTASYVRMCGQEANSSYMSLIRTA